MPQAVDLNWTMLKATCAARKGHCAAAIVRLRADAPDGLMNKGVRAIEAVTARLDAMISECESKLATRRWEALLASRRAAAAAAIAAIQPQATSSGMLRRVLSFHGNP